MRLNISSAFYSYELGFYCCTTLKIKASAWSAQTNFIKQQGLNQVVFGLSYALNEELSAPCCF
jgi:hypothetical protein